MEIPEISTQKSREAAQLECNKVFSVQNKQTLQIKHVVPSYSIARQIQIDERLPKIQRLCSKQNIGNNV